VIRLTAVIDRFVITDVIHDELHFAPVPHSHTQPIKLLVAVPSTTSLQLHPTGVLIVQSQPGGCQPQCDVRAQ
jgi:hypothetical protein